MTDKFTLKLRRLEATDRRLGRHVGHDSRSLRFLAPARDPRKLTSTRHHVNIGIMNQDEGSCTGHGELNVLASDPFWPACKTALGDTDPHAYAVGLYSDATKIDPWPGEYLPDDTGSDGLSAAKVALARGLISGYQHATSLEAALTALAERAVMVGTSWLDGMYYPGADGQLKATGASMGGHEYALDELDVPRRRVWLRNSWGPGWGLEGRAWLSWDDLGTLLADDGDCTVLVPLSQPAPQPTPAPTPKPAQRPEDAPLAKAFKQYLKTSAGPGYLRRAGANWIAAFSKE